MLAARACRIAGRVRVGATDRPWPWTTGLARKTAPVGVALGTGRLLRTSRGVGRVGGEQETQTGDAAATTTAGVTEDVKSPPDAAVSPTPTQTPSRPTPPPLGLASQALSRMTGFDEDSVRPSAGKQRLSSAEKQRRTVGRIVGVASLLGLGYGLLQLARPLEEDVERKEFEQLFGTRVTAPDGTTHVQPPRLEALARIRFRIGEMVNYFSRPQWEVLLPDPLPEPYQKPYTLVIDLDDFLVHSKWDREHGWRTAKRPGVDYFLGYLCQMYEIVIFTTQQGYSAQPIIQKLDPYQRYISYTLFRESTKLENGRVVKDLSHLNRDLSKVFIIDPNPDHFSVQPENAIPVEKWQGEAGDRGLIELIPFLESVAFHNTPDVRPVLKSLKEGDGSVALEYAKREQASKAEFLEKVRKEQEGKKGTRLLQSTLASILGGLTGISGSPTAGGGQAVAKSQEPKSYLELQREKCQALYLEEQEHWRLNEENYKKMFEEQEAEALKNVKSSVWSFFTTGQAQQMDKPPSAPAPASETSTSASRESERPRSLLGR